MTAKFTPGPWVVKGCGIYREQSLGGDLIAATGDDAMNSETAETQIANAKIIAKAPQMFELLKECVDGTFGDCTYWNSRARKLLKEATE